MWAIVINTEPETLVYVLNTEQEAQQFGKDWVLDELRMLINESKDENEKAELNDILTAFSKLTLYQMFGYDEFNEYLSVDHMEVVKVSPL